MNRITLVAFIVFSSAIGRNSEGNDFTSRRVQLSCSADGGLAVGAGHPVQGRDGKRGPAGIRGPRGPIGLKGSKGEPCDCCSQLADIEDRLASLELQACPQSKFVFSNGKQITDWIRVKERIQEFNKATVCAWITPPSSSSAVTGAILSYATSTRDNEFILFYPNNSTFDIYAKGANVRTALPITKRTHICVIISRSDGYTKVFSNGALHASLLFSDRLPIEGGGALIVGQEQDSVLGGFDKNQAFSGTIENLMMWYRTLHDKEITSLYSDRCSCPKGYSIAFTTDQIQFEGKVKSIAVNGC